ncbi:MAG: recombinase family protein [Archaeoglobi archaeon]|nr:recombinase family protein [Candidatus Mnemosynella bozhongmuii]
MRCAIYARVSTEEQKKNGISIDAQVEFLRRWVQLDGYEVVDEYIDEGYSGGSLERPELQRLIEDVKKRRFDFILVYHNDRLSRDTKQALDLIQLFLRYGIRVRCSNIDVDVSDPEGELLFTLLSAFATYFRKDLIWKTKFGMQRLKELGYWVGRVPDFFEAVREDGHLKIKPTEVALRILELRERGLSTRKIAETISSEIGQRVNHTKVWRTLRVFERMNGRATVEIRLR